MKLTNTQRDQAYEKASPHQLFLYEDPISGNAMWNIASTHQLTTNYSEFAIAIGDVILDLMPQEKLPELLIERLQVSQADAMRITADVLDFLEPLNEPVAMSVPIHVEPQVDKQTSDSDTLAAELAETEAAFKQLQPIRTMAHDMETLRTEEAPVHQATSQETILNGQGNAGKNTEAQWGTPEK